MKKNELLFELRTEEIPVSYIEPSIKQCRISLDKLFQEYLLDVDIDKSLKIYATCRRLIINIKKFPEKQLTKDEIIKGPPVDIAYKDGKPTNVLGGFLKKCGITNADKLDKTEIKNKTYLIYRKKIGGKNSRVILPQIFTGMLNKLQFPKKMKWGKHDFLYPRPITGILFMLGEKSVSMSICGIKSKKQTIGHFIRFPSPVKINDPSDFFKALSKNGVIFDQNKRKDVIKKNLEKKAEKLKLMLREDKELLEIVNYLVEDPYIIGCRFSKKYLNIPDAVIISEMREHQKYFSLLEKNGKISNHFLVVANMPRSKYIVDGNQRVLTARLEDGRFYYEEDIKNTLSSRIENLKKIVFQKKLGSVYEKLSRVLRIAKSLNEIIKFPVDDSILEKTVFLSKADLSTRLVSEFPALQGHIGAIYAEKEGLGNDICRAIEEHYRPVFAGDLLPANDLGILISLADKLDNLMGNFSIGNIPTGSADPLALRRQAMAIVEMILKINKPLNLTQFIEKIVPVYPNKIVTKGKNKEEQPLSLFAWNFISRRVFSVLKEKGLRKDLIQSALSANLKGSNSGNICEIFGISNALNELSDQQSFIQILLSIKRMGNIIKTAPFDSDKIENTQLDNSLFENESEIEMFNGARELQDIIKEIDLRKNYIEIFRHLNKLYDTVNNFFDHVMVMVEDEKICLNRLKLLSLLYSPISKFLDTTQIEANK
jgi:glycyl-tRNA synthetase beta chain